MIMHQIRPFALLAFIIVGSVSMAGCTGVPASCNDGEIATFDTASNSWVCDTRGYVLLDANGTQIGPVVGYNVTDATVAVTLPDTANTPRTVLLAATGKRLFGSPLEPVYFTQPACAGDAFVETPVFAQLSPLYELGHIDGTPPEPERLYVVDQSTTATPTLVSQRTAFVCVEQGPSNPTADFHPLDLLSADLQALYPAPHTLQAQ